MDFSQINNFIRSAPPIVHAIAGAIVLAMLSHLTIGLRNIWKFKRKRIRTYLLASLAIVTYLFLGKLADPGFTMCDIFLPLYIIYYFHSLLVMQARFFKCFKDLQTFKQLFNLQKPKTRL